MKANEQVWINQSIDIAAAGDFTNGMFKIPKNVCKVIGLMYAVTSNPVNADFIAGNLRLGFNNNMDQQSLPIHSDHRVVDSCTNTIINKFDYVLSQYIDRLYGLYVLNQTIVWSELRWGFLDSTDSGVFVPYTLDIWYLTVQKI